MVSTILSVLRFALWSVLGSLTESVLRALEKNAHAAAVGGVLCDCPLWFTAFESFFPLLAIYLVLLIMKVGAEVYNCC